MTPLSIVRRLLIAFLPFAFASCASLKTENMIPDQETFGATYAQTVALDVGGGSAGVQWFSGTIKPEDLEEAIVQSLEKSKLFSEVVEPEQADYILGVNLTYAGSHPGFTMKAWVNVEWDLAARTAAESKWKEELKAEAKATVGEAFNGTSRQYRALEKAAKLNIEEAFAKIAELGL